MKGSRLKTEKWGNAVTITLTFFFGLLMFSSFGRLGDLLDSLPSSGAPVFSNSDFSAIPPGYDIKDLGWSFVSESEMCENLTTLRNVWKALRLWKWMLTSQYAVLSHSWWKIWNVHLHLAKNPVLIKNLQINEYNHNTEKDTHGFLPVCCKQNIMLHGSS